MHIHIRVRSPSTMRMHKRIFVHRICMWHSGMGTAQPNTIHNTQRSTCSRADNVSVIHKRKTPNTKRFNILQWLLCHWQRAILPAALGLLCNTKALALRCMQFHSILCVFLSRPTQLVCTFPHSFRFCVCADEDDIPQFPELGLHLRK